MNSVAGAERRASRRQTGADCAWLTGARLRHGLDVAVLDIATGGAMVEAAARLLPGALVELHLSAPGWEQCVPARVLRCHVSAVVPDDGVRYRAALGFTAPLTLPRRLDGDRLPRGGPFPRAAGAGSPADIAGSLYPRSEETGVGREGTTQTGLELVAERRLQACRRGQG
jgi:hypothetical protein